MGFYYHLRSFWDILLGAFAAQCHRAFVAQTLLCHGGLPGKMPSLHLGKGPMHIPGEASVTMAC